LIQVILREPFVEHERGAGRERRQQADDLGIDVEERQRVVPAVVFREAEMRGYGLADERELIGAKLDALGCSGGAGREQHGGAAVAERGCGIHVGCHAAIRRQRGWIDASHTRLHREVGIRADQGGLAVDQRRQPRDVGSAGRRIDRDGSVARRDEAEMRHGEGQRVALAQEDRCTGVQATGHHERCGSSSSVAERDRTIAPGVLEVAALAVRGGPVEQQTSDRGDAHTVCSLADHPSMVSAGAMSARCARSVRGGRGNVAVHPVGGVAQRRRCQAASAVLGDDRCSPRPASAPPRNSTVWWAPRA
jgi:hypothetical protein